MSNIKGMGLNNALSLGGGTITGNLNVNGVVKAGGFTLDFANGDVKLVRDAAAVLAQKDGEVAQTLRIYGTTTGPKYVEMLHDGTRGIVRAGAGDVLFLGANGAGYWQIDTSGHLLAIVDNARDLGASGATRPRTGYFGTSLVIGTAGWTASATAATGLTAQGNSRFAHGTTALAASATEGFLHLQSCAGLPTGTPATIPTGQIPLVVNTVTDQINLFSTTWKALHRTLDVNSTAVGNITTGTDDLISYTLPANVLSATGKTVRISAWGQTANNANAKTLTFNVGSQTVVSTALTASIVGMWEMEVTIIRTGSNTQDIMARVLQGATLIFDQELTAGTQTDSSTIVLKCTGTATATNDIVQEGMITEIIN